MNKPFLFCFQFLIFVKMWTFTFTFYFWLINLWRNNKLMFGKTSFFKFHKILIRQKKYWKHYYWLFWGTFFNVWTISNWAWKEKQHVVRESWEKSYRSSRSQIFFEIGFLKYFIKKRFQYKCFPVKFAKFLRTSFFTEHLQWLLLKLNIFMLKLPIYYILE